MKNKIIKNKQIRFNKKSKLLRSKFNPTIALNFLIIKVQKILLKYCKNSKSLRMKVYNPDLKIKYFFNLSKKDEGFSKDFLISKGLREPFFQKYFFNLINNKDIILDLGANLGIYSVLGGIKAKKVYSIEPNPGAYKILKSNIKKNKRIKSYNLAIGEENKKVLFELSNKWNLEKVVDKPRINKKYIKVEMETASTFIKKNKLEKPSVFKMDVEGYEYQIIKKMYETGFLKSIKKIFMELHPDIIGTKKVEEIFNYLKAYNLYPKYFISELEPSYFLLPKCLRKLKLLCGRYGIYNPKDFKFGTKDFYKACLKAKEMIFIKKILK